MNISDIVLEMRQNGILQTDIDQIITLFHEEALSLEMLDDELIKRGYEKIFTVNYEDYDLFDDSWEDEEYYSIEPFRKKTDYK